MLNYNFLVIILMSLLFSCGNSKSARYESMRQTQVVKAFSSHLYRDYYRYSKRVRNDSNGGRVRSWPINHRVDDPHYALKIKRAKKNQK